MKRGRACLNKVNESFQLIGDVAALMKESP